MKKILIIVLAFLMVLLSCKIKSDKKDEVAPGKETEMKVNPDAVVILDVSIKGMSCTGCENTIKSSISGLPGVVDVSASYIEGKAVVKLDTSLTKMDKISEAVNSRGYTVTGLKLSSTISPVQ